METKNYSAWKINLEDFYKFSSWPERLRFLVGLAVLAPSANNTQPWKFKIQENRLELWPEWSRSFQAADANHRQVYLSLGCALENLLVAADFYGLRFELAILPRGESGPAAEMIFPGGEISPKRKDHHLIFAIPERRTNRHAYESKMPEQSFLIWLKSFTNSELRVDAVVEPVRRDALAEVIVEANVAAMDDARFRRELAPYIKSNYTRSGVGMPGFVLGMKTVLSLVAGWLIKWLSPVRKNKEKDLFMLKNHTPVFVVVSSKEDGPPAWLKVGQVFERIALEAARHGLATGPYSSPIQFGKYYETVQKIVGANLRSQFIFRVGYPQTQYPEHTPRLLPEEVIR